MDLVILHIKLCSFLLSVMTSLCLGLYHRFQLRSVSLALFHQSYVDFARLPTCKSTWRLQEVVLKKF